jgi:hypothetical protein
MSLGSPHRLHYVNLWNSLVHIYRCSGEKEYDRRSALQPETNLGKDLASIEEESTVDTNIIKGLIRVKRRCSGQRDWT